MGEVPLGRGRVLNHPNLTVDPEPDHQDWAAPPGESITGGRTIAMKLNKRAVRISVHFSNPDPLMVRWVDWARASGIDEVYLRGLNAAGGGRMDDWWIYRGVIAPGRFKAVDFLDSGVVPELELRAIAATRRARGSRFAMAMLGEPPPGAA